MERATTCNRHGAQRTAIICSHLIGSVGLSYHMIEEVAGEPAHAWCADCDDVRADEQGWSEPANASARWELLCQVCFDNELTAHSPIDRQ